MNTTTLRSGTALFTATIDREARSVRVVITEESACVPLRGVAYWPSAEAPDFDDVRERIEEAFDVWLDPLPADGDWHPCDGSLDVFANVPLHGQQPTHRIEILLGSGAMATKHVDLVFFDVDRETGDGSAYTHCEYDGEFSASWVVDGGRWYCDGEETPGGANGTVTVTRVAR